ncbi:hypothetical protein [Pseudomonas sp. UBA6310]|uniref:hypothetical protein n=1 Tax=Pseudomonas sp. UBA6310 TaxID=1947327 RepID=UPI00257BA189|nr:hypothetical protein [Pseudomonas sp. UBA6310]
MLEQIGQPETSAKPSQSDALSARERAFLALFRCLGAKAQEDILLFMEALEQMTA